MNTYEERLPLIDAAIENLNGEFPQEYNNPCLLQWRRSGKYCTVTNDYNSGETLFICTREEFEQRVKEREEMSELKLGNFYSLNELSKIDGAFDKGNFYLYVGESDGVYLSGKVYPTNGRGIVDEYDKGNHTSYCNLGGVTPDFQLVALLNSQLEDVNKNDWYEKGELPPVGEVVEVYVDNSDYWAKVKVLAVDGGNVVWRNGSDGLSYIGTPLEYVRPLRTETDKLVEQMCDDAGRIEGAELNPFIVAAIERLAEQGYRKIKQQTEDEFTAQWQELTDYVSTYQLSKLYRAGCRFIEQVEV